MFNKISSSYIRLLVAIVSLFGLFVSVYLLYTYVNGGPIRCLITHGCDVVRASRYAWVFGIPMPVFGVLFFADIFAVCVLRSATQKQRSLLLRLQQGEIVAGFLFSVFLFFVQWLDLKAFCFWCELSALATLFLLLLTPFDSAEVLPPEKARWELQKYLLILFLFLPLAAGAFYLLVF
ncbi:hypothetical protein EXS71_04850 [Candidatus Uhrbacteria bacterium]|nr:hypothetical protein [Candidatus Uhrbacteria bacterium]